MNIFSLRSDTHRVTIHKLFIFNEYINAKNNEL